MNSSLPHLATGWIVGYTVVYSWVANSLDKTEDEWVLQTNGFFRLSSTRYTTSARTSIKWGATTAIIVYGIYYSGETIATILFHQVSAHRLLLLTVKIK